MDTIDIGINEAERIAVAEGLKRLLADLTPFIYKLIIFTGT